MSTADESPFIPLSDDEKIAVRQLCGYPADNIPVGRTGWQFYRCAGLLQFSP